MTEIVVADFAIRSVGLFPINIELTNVRSVLGFVISTRLPIGPDFGESWNWDSKSSGVAPSGFSLPLLCDSRVFSSQTNISSLKFPQDRQISIPGKIRPMTRVHEYGSKTKDSKGDLFDEQ